MEQDIFGRHFLCYFPRVRVKKAWAQAHYQPIIQKSPLLSRQEESSQPRSQGLSLCLPCRLRRKTLVQAGHVPPRIWEVPQICIWGGDAM